MALGRRRASRRAIIEQASLVWSIGETDLQAYLDTGSLAASKRGGPLRLDPALEEAVAEQERLIMANEGQLPSP